MEENGKSQKIERWLDAGLKKYTDVEPRAGLEVRILAGVRTEPRYARWQWNTAITAAALIIVVSIFLRVYRKPELGSRSAISNNISPSAGTVSKPAPPLRLATSSRVHSKPREPEMRAGQFPTPRALTPPEEWLLAYVNQNPSEALAVASTQEKMASNLQVEALHISRLNIEESNFSSDSGDK
jgi:hypothetical protein